MMSLGFVPHAEAADEVVGLGMTTATADVLIDEQTCPSELRAPTPLDRLWERVELEPDV